jgi:hypothetical protein
MRADTFAFLCLLPLAACTTESPAPPHDEPVPEFVNWTDTEKAAWRSEENRGTLVLTVKDVDTGAPVTDCDYHAAKFAFEKRLVAAHPSNQISKPPAPEVEDGRFRWDLAAGWHQLRVDAKGYRNKWTPVFRIEAGRETTLDLTMRLANRLRVVVLDEHGKPLKEGGVHLVGKGFRAGMHIENGVGEQLVPVDEITVTVGDVFLKEYAHQKITVPLKPNGVNTVTIRLRR